MRTTEWEDKKQSLRWNGECWKKVGWQVLGQRTEETQSRRPKAWEFVGMGAVQEGFLKEVLSILSSIYKGTEALNGWLCVALSESTHEVHSPGWRCTS